MVTLVKPSLHVSNGEHEGLSFKEIEQWKNEGWLLLDRLLPEELIHQVATKLHQEFPSNAPTGEEDFGSNGKMEFPCDMNELNTVTLHPILLTVAAQLLGSNDIRLTQSDAWPKYGKATSNNLYDNRDQRIHVDFPNHTLVVPPSWNSPEAIAVIVYYSEQSECEGGTALVPRQGENDAAYQHLAIMNTPGLGAVPWMNDRILTEAQLQTNEPEMFKFRQELYKREVVTDYHKGTVLLYRHDIWHRGTPVKVNTCRFAQNLVYKRAGCDWLTSWNYGWARSMYSRQMTLEKIIASATVQQRNSLGFPPPGHTYWTSATLEAVRQRYEPLGMDLSPYASVVDQ